MCAVDPAAEVSGETALSTPTGIRRIALVEDDAIVRAHFVDLIGSQSALSLIGAAVNIAEAKDLIPQQPELFLVDLGLPDGSGLDLISAIRRGCSARVLVITSFGDRETVVAAIEPGADGYLLKDSSSQAIIEGIQITLQGGAPISAAAAVYLLDKLRRPDPTRQAARGNAEEAQLTVREIELPQCFARGESYKEAARSLSISPLTVGGFVKSIYRKLAVHSRGEAVFAAVKQGQLRI